MAQSRIHRNEPGSACTWGRLPLHFATTLLAVLGAVPCDAHAQRVPLIMQHGIRSDASTWNTADDSLRNSFPIRVERRSTSWRQPFTLQVAEIGSFLGALPDTSLAVGHSAGSLVLRQAVLGGESFKAMASIGTPHWGAPVASNVRNGTMPYIFTPVSSTLDFLSYIFFPLDGMDLQEDEALSAPMALAYVLLYYATLGLSYFDFVPSYPIWEQLSPSGSAIPRLNLGDSLAAQAQRVPTRRSIMTRINNPDDALWRLVASEDDMSLVDAMRNTLTYYSLFASLFVGGKYCYYPQYNPSKRSAAIAWADLALLVQLLDSRYCYQLFVENASAMGSMQCGASDSVVPLGNQVWGAGGYSTLRQVNGVAHAEQTKSRFVIDELRAFLLDDGGVSRCGQGPVATALVSGAFHNLVSGTSRSLQLRGLDACNVQTSQATAFQLTSSNPAVISTTVDQNGFGSLTAHAQGSVTITGIVNGKSTSFTVQVAAPAELTVSLSASPNGGFLPGDEVQLVADIVTGSPIEEITWSIGGQLVPGGASTLVMYYTTPTTITVTVRNSAGTVQSASVSIAP